MSYDEFKMPHLTTEEYKSFSKLAKERGVGWCKIEKAWVVDPSDCCTQLPGFRLYLLVLDWAKSANRKARLDIENERIIIE